ncbi:RING finger protein 150-like isoform X1 [Lampetra planeri]
MAGLLCRLVAAALLSPAAWPGASSATDKEESWYTAFVNISYVEPDSREPRSERTECGRYGDDSPKVEARGILVAPTGDRSACDPATTRFNVPVLPPSSAQLQQQPSHGPGQRLRAGSGGGSKAASVPWVALISKENCSVRDKILRAMAHNASAVVIANGPGTGNETTAMHHKGQPVQYMGCLFIEVHYDVDIEDTGEIVVIMVTELKGREMMSLLERNITVMVHVTVGTRNVQKFVSRTSVVFVSISFIVLMIISLAWLVFYYVQRLRYASARDRHQRRLGDAAKKAMTKLPLKTIKKGDQETEPDFDNCAVCIEGYKPSDVVRILPCKHLFHKACVDPWLLDHRTCPMCKLNILKALGFPTSPEPGEELPPPAVGVSAMAALANRNAHEGGAAGGGAMAGIGRVHGGYVGRGIGGGGSGAGSGSDSSLNLEPPQYEEVVQVAHVEPTTPSTPHSDADIDFHDDEERLVRDRSSSQPITVEIRLSDIDLADQSPRGQEILS